MKALQLKTQILNEMVALGKQIFEGDEAAASLFIQQFFKRMPVEFIEKFGMQVLLRQAQGIWELLHSRPESKSKLRVSQRFLDGQKSQRLCIETINDNRPFLVDSLTIVLDNWGIKPELIIHPVLGVVRDKEGQMKAVYESRDIIEHTHRNIHEESIIYIQSKAFLTDKQIQELTTQLETAIQDTYWVVDDWQDMRHQIIDLADSLARLKSCLPAMKHQLVDTKAFLHWLEEHYFVFLGARYFSAYIGKSPSDLSILCLERKEDRYPNLGLFRSDFYADKDDLVPGVSRARPVPEALPAGESQLPVLTVIKTNQRSSVHRASRIDSIEVMDFDDEGNIRGLFQFIGIFTKDFFNVPAFEVPVLNRKVNAVFDRFGLAPQWHDGKILISILNSVPRDEMFYLSEEQLYAVALKALQLKDHGELGLFLRPDVYGRYMTALIFLPRERYSFEVNQRFGEMLSSHFHAKIASTNVSVGDLPFARLVYIMTFPSPRHIEPDQEALEEALAEASLTWKDRFNRELTKEFDEELGGNFIRDYDGAFTAAYIEKFSPKKAVQDVRHLEGLFSNDKEIDISFYQNRREALKVAIFYKNTPLSLSQLLPILQNFGLQITAETSYLVTKGDQKAWIHDFETSLDQTIDWRLYQQSLSEAFFDVWEEKSENDPLNQLIIKAGLLPREVVLIRTYLKFLRQIRLPYSHTYIETALVTHADITGEIVSLFKVKFDPSLSKERENLVHDKITLINKMMTNVTRLDFDRILRRLLNALQSTLRTNYYQKTDDGEVKPYISLKMDCHLLEWLPNPRPLYEIFVYSSFMEAAHLRGGKVARGGIRWSDRFEDFRTEILGLMKAQMVKNSVIVPLGSKGGFVVKRQEKIKDRSELAAEVIRCYKTMMYGLLDITDNIVNGQIIPPKDVIRYDDDDPYLVVAADKGTATFSDIANAVSKEYGFWLGDAFASGGSAGYDHKKIGITARGAWESVKRHFRELHLDVQSTPFTVVGVGDMAGDVFGNGMLQSKHIKLVAAFNHQHIFIDPNPDCQKSYEERARLFNLPRSTWADYDTSTLSTGGGIYDRSAKFIELSLEAQIALGVRKNQFTPDELIRCILQAPVDLLWFGGIGTFIKASFESNTDVGDQANNDLRVDASTVQARVIAEGANLGMTQLGRVEYALKGGHLNTDAIDNSGGVDCSDHEVNIKILFQSLPQAISEVERDSLLREMTEDVARLVLNDNYRQTQILSVLSSLKENGINLFQSLMKTLENTANLDRKIEFLPDDEILDRRRGKGQGLTRPELAVLLAYSKIALHELILNSPLPDKPAYQPLFIEYFPPILHKKYGQDMLLHPLRKEITATVMANEMINRVGPTFLYEISQASGQSTSDVVDAFFTIVHFLNLKQIWDEIDSLDTTMLTTVQTEALVAINRMLTQAILGYLRHKKLPADTISILRALKIQFKSLLQEDQLESFRTHENAFIALGLNATLAADLVLIQYLPSLLDIAVLSEHHPHTKVARTYFALRSKIRLDWLFEQILNLQVDAEWQRSARLSILDDLAQVQSVLVGQVLEKGILDDIESWIESNAENLQRFQPILATIKSGSRPDLGLLGHAVRQLQKIAG